MSIFLINLLFILIIAIISFQLSRIILTEAGLDETTTLIASIPLAIFISSLIFVLIGKVIRRHLGNSASDEAITGVVSEIIEVKGKNGLTCFKFKVNDRSYELPLLPETYFLLNLEVGERIMIPLTQDIKRYLSAST